MAVRWKGCSSGVDSFRHLLLAPETIFRPITPDINPDAGVNIGMQDLANRANYQAANYAAREQAASGMAQGLFGALGTGVAGYFNRP